MRTGGNRKLALSLIVHLSVTFSLIFLTCPQPVAGSGQPADDFFYYSDGRKIPLTVSNETVAVRFKADISLEQRQTIAQSDPNLGAFSKRQELAIFNLTLLPLHAGLTKGNVIQTINALNAKAEVRFVSPVFNSPQTQIIITDEFAVKFRPSVAEAEINAFNTQHNVEIVSKCESRQRYILRLKNATYSDTLRLTNLYHENPLDRV